MVSMLFLVRFDDNIVSIITALRVVPLHFPFPLDPIPLSMTMAVIFAHTGASPLWTCMSRYDLLYCSWAGTFRVSHSTLFYVAS